jgi:hypothetical protein
MFNNYIWIERDASGQDIFCITTDENTVPAGKIAARAVLTEAERQILRNCVDWHEYQSWLEHFFDRGQKVVTANN